jgi:hypothetical protein
MTIRLHLSANQSQLHDNYYSESSCEEVLRQIIEELIGIRWVLQTCSVGLTVMAA